MERRARERRERQARGSPARHGVYGALDCTKFFFTNFPSGVGEVDMHRIFQKWARVKEVFISQRLNKWGRRFGFVSFFGVSDAGRLERELDQVYIGSRKLHVNIPKYKFSASEHRRTKMREQRSSSKEKQPVQKMRNQKESEPPRKQSSKDMWLEKKGKRSYAEVVAGKYQEQWKGPSLKAHFSIMPWMECSAVGKLREDVDEVRLGEEIVKGGMNTFKVRPLGDNMVMLTPSEGESMEVIIKQNGVWFDSVFASLKPWTVTSVSSHRIVWVRCYGLPLSVWNRECFSKLIGLAAPSAVLMAIDNLTETWETLEYARPQVRILKLESVRLAKCVQVNKQLCNILIEEEVPAGIDESYKVNYALSESFGSVSSTETYVEETEFSDNLGAANDRLWEEEERRLRRKEVEQAAEGGGEQSPKTIKQLLEGCVSHNKSWQRKTAEEKTNVERKVQKVSEGVDLLLSDIVGKTALRNDPSQGDMAKVVMDIEKANNVQGLGEGSGHVRMLKAHPSPAHLNMVHNGNENRLDEELNGHRDTTGFSRKMGVNLYEGPFLGHTLLSHKPIYEGPSYEGCGAKRGSSLMGTKEGRGEKPEHGARKEVHSFHWVQDGNVKGRSVSNSPPRRRKKKVLAELGESSSHPRRSARISARLSKMDAIH